MYILAIRKEGAVVGDIISRKEAAQAALPVYFDGEFCKEGHLSERFTVSGQCCECVKERKENFVLLYGEEKFKEKIDKIKKKTKRRERKTELYKEIIEDNTKLIENLKNRLVSHKSRNWQEGSTLEEVSPEQIIEIMEDQGFCCKACFEPFTAVGFQIEHIVPVNSFGSHSIRNIQLLCSSCNQSKGDKEYNYWLSKLRHKQVVDYLAELSQEGV